MKRIILICMVTMFSLSGIANAEIKKGVDSFTNGIHVCSLAQNSLEKVEFHKVISDGQSLYEVMVSLSELKEMKNYLLADRPIKIKIDGYPVFELPRDRYSIIDADDNICYISTISAKLTQEIAEKIKDAKRVAIRYEDIGGRKGAPYILSDEVLSEWKQVINTTE